MSNSQPAERAAEAALASLGLPAEELQLVRSGRFSLFRATTDAGAGPERYAVRVTDDEAVATIERRSHFIATLLFPQGVSVPRPLGAAPMVTPWGEASVTEWVDGAGLRLRLSEAGGLLRQMHDVRSMPASLRVMNHLKFFEAEIALYSQLSRTPGHPLNERPGVVDAFRRAVADAHTGYQRAAASDDAVFLHGDWWPGNVVPDRRSGGKILDLESAGWGPRGVDFARLAVAVERIGWPVRAYEEFCRGYGPEAPSLDAVAPYRRIAELMTIGFTMEEAHRSPRHMREFLLRLPALIEPEARTPSWSFLTDGRAEATWRLESPGTGTRLG